MEINDEEKDWCLTLQGASGNPPTEKVIQVGKDTSSNNGLRLINAFFRPKVLAVKGNVPIPEKNIRKNSYTINNVFVELYV